MQRRMHNLARAAPALLACALGACAGPDLRPGLAASDANTRVRHVLGASATEAELVDALSDSDVAVRYAAIGALRQRSGQSFGYDALEGAQGRAQSLARWRAWLARSR
jgi:hypothetical protein